MKVKKLTSVIAIIMMLLLFVLPLSPAAAQPENKGSITLNLTNNETGQPLANEFFRLYFIAKAIETSDGIRYEMIPPYDQANIDTDNLQDSALPIHLTYFAESNSQPYTEKATDENGTLVFDNLTPGLYLVVPSQNDGNASASPFLVSVPSYDTENDRLEYDIDASPKFIGGDIEDDGETYISVIKKWETSSGHPDSVTVVLLCDFQEYETVVLNASNNWHYRWDNLPKNHIWNVVEADVPRGFTVYYDVSSNTVTIINKSESSQEEDTTAPPEKGTEEDKLVHTGQLNWPVPVCAIAGLLIFSIGWAILNLGRKESE